MIEEEINKNYPTNLFLKSNFLVIKLLPNQNFNSIPFVNKSLTRGESGEFRRVLYITGLKLLNSPQLTDSRAVNYYRGHPIHHHQYVVSVIF